MTTELEQAKKHLPRQVIEGYAMKGVKSLETSRGVAWTGTLLKDGQPVADIEDRGDGGQLWITPKAGHREDALIKDLERAAATLPPVKMFDAEPPMPYNHEMLLAELSAGKEELARLKRAAKTKVVAWDNGETYTFKLAPTQANFDAVRKKHPGAVILNPALE